MTPQAIVRVTTTEQNVTFTLQEGRNHLKDPPEGSELTYDPGSYMLHTVASTLGGPHWQEIDWLFVDEKGRQISRIDAVPLNITVTGPLAK